MILNSDNKNTGEQLAMGNMIFIKEANRMIVGQNADENDVFFDVKSIPSLAIFDNDNERLIHTINDFTDKLAESGDFDVIHNDNGRFDSCDGETVFCNRDINNILDGICAEIKKRMALFTEMQVKSIAEFNKKCGAMKHIALFIGGDLINNRVSSIMGNKSLNTILLLGRAVGVFTCLYAQPLRRTTKTYSYIKMQVPYWIDCSGGNNTL